MESIKMLCNRGVVLHNGGINMLGSAEECVSHYINSLAIEKIIRKTIIEEKHRDNYFFLTKDIEFKEVSILNENPEAIANDEPLSFSVKLVHNHGSQNFQLCVFFQNISDIRVVFCMTKTLCAPANKKEFEVKIGIPHHSLPKGRYSVRMETNLQDFNSGSKHFDFVHHVLSFEVKYIHQEKKDEFLFWNSNFGETLQLEKSILAEVT